MVNGEERKLEMLFAVICLCFERPGGRLDGFHPRQH